MEKEKVTVLQGINLSVEKGKIFEVVGFSDAVKSTLICCVNLLERPTFGKVMTNSVDLLELIPIENGNDLF